MGRKPRILMALLFTMSLACGKQKSEESKTSGTEETASESQLALSELNGIWGACNDAYNSYDEVEFQDGAFTSRSISYAGSVKCQPGQEIKEYVARGVITPASSEDDTLPAPAPSAIINVKVEDYMVIYYDQDAAFRDSGLYKSSVVSLEPACQDTVFMLSTPQSLIGKSCGSMQGLPRKLIEGVEYRDRLAATAEELYFSSKMFALLPSKDNETLNGPVRAYMDTNAKLLKQTAKLTVARANPLASVAALDQKLQGSWEQCDDDNDAYVVIEFRGDGTYTQQVTYYNFLLCNGTYDPADRTFSLTFTGNYMLGGASALAPGGFEIDWGSTDIILETYSNDTSDFFNGAGLYAGDEPFCSNQTFVTDQPQSILNKNCKLYGDAYELIAPNTLYDVMFLDLKADALYDSLPSGEPGEGSSPETRTSGFNWTARYTKKP